MSVLIGKHQLIGGAQIQRVNVPNGDHRVPGRYLTYENTYKGIHDDENNVVRITEHSAHVYM